MKFLKILLSVLTCLCLIGCGYFTGLGLLAHQWLLAGVSGMLAAGFGYFLFLDIKARLAK